MRVLGISGSLRRDSHNTALLRAAGERLPAGAELSIYEGLAEIPPYSEDIDPYSGDFEGAAPEPVNRFREAVAAADAVLIATPEYNHSIPGQLKNALDWLSRPANESPLRGKPVAVIGATKGMFGAVWAQAEARKVAGAMGAKVIDAELPVGHVHEHRDPSSGVLDLEAELAATLAETLGQLVGEEVDEAAAAELLVV